MKNYILNTRIIVGYSPGILVDSIRDLVYVEDHVYAILLDKRISLKRNNTDVDLKSESDLLLNPERIQDYFKAGKDTLKITISISNEEEELLTLFRLYDIADIKKPL